MVNPKSHSRAGRLTLGLSLGSIAVEYKVCDKTYRARFACATLPVHLGLARVQTLSHGNVHDQEISTLENQGSHDYTIVVPEHCQLVQAHEADTVYVRHKKVDM